MSSILVMERFTLKTISEGIQQMGSSDNWITDNSERLYIGNEKVAYESTNTVIYIQQVFKNHDQCTSHKLMHETLWYLALQGWYNINLTTVFYLLSTTNTQRNTCSAQLLRLQRCQQESFFYSILQQAPHVRETHVCRVCSNIELLSVADATVRFSVPNFGQLVHVPIEEDLGHEVSWLVLRHYQNVLIDSIFIHLQNRLLYYHQPFHCPTSVKHVKIDCKVEYTNGNKVIMSESDDIGVQYMYIRLITPSQAKFLRLQLYSFARLHRIRSFNLVSTCQLEQRHWLLLRGARRHNNGYFILIL